MDAVYSFQIHTAFPVDCPLSSDVPQHGKNEPELIQGYFDWLAVCIELDNFWHVNT